MADDAGTAAEQGSGGAVAQAAKAGGNVLLFAGILSVLGGIFCLVAPRFMGWMGVFLFGIMLVVLGALQVLGGIDMHKGTKGRGWTIFGGVVAVILGLMFVTKPFDVMAVATWLIGIFLLLEGVMRILASFDWKPAKGWGWLLFGGATAIVLGILILSSWPYSAEWFLGTVIGIHFLVAGFAKIMVGSALRKAARGG